MIKLLRVDIDREWTSEYKLGGIARFEKDGQEFSVKLSNKDCATASQHIEQLLVNAAKEQTAAQIEALKND